MSWGIIFNGFHLETVIPGYWAADHTNLADFIGYTIVKVDDFDVSSREELHVAKEQLAGKEDVVFTLQKIVGPPVNCTDNENFVDDVG